MNQEFVAPECDNTVYEKSTGKLYQFSQQRITVYSSAWPSPLAWAKWPGSNGWRHCRPFDVEIPGGSLDREIAILSSDSDGQLLLPFGIKPKARRRAAGLRWFRDIPVDVRNQIASFRLGCHWHLLSFLARCGKPASDIVDANPALAFMLATNGNFRSPGVQQPLRAARRLLRKRQDAALEWLGFPGNKSTRRITAKINPAGLSVDILLKLREVLTERSNPRALKCIYHLDTLNFGVLRIICEDHLLELVAGSLLDDVRHCPQDDSCPDTATQLVRTQRLWLILRRFERMPVFRRRQQVLDLRCELEDELLRLGGLGNLNLKFPDPPLSGDRERIVPICDVRTLVEEGRRQHNCAAGMLSSILQGNIFLYQVNSPERCTLSMVHSGTAWELGELKGPCNAEPGMLTRTAVAAWTRSLTCGP